MPFTTDLPAIHANLTDYSATVEVQSLDPSNLNGSTGSVNLSGVVPEGSQPQRLKNKRFTLTDDDAGSVIGRVSVVTNEMGMVTVSGETMLNRLAVDVTVHPRQEDLDTGMDAVLALVGMSGTGLSSDEVVFPGWVGSLLDYLKHFCAVFDYELVPSPTDPDVVVFRAIRASTSIIEYASKRLEVNSQNLAKSVSITDYQYGLAPGGDLHTELTPSAAENMQVLTVESGEVAVYDIQLNAWAASVIQPVAHDLIGPEVRTDDGAYCVSGADGLPVTASQWTALGGSVAVEITEDPSILRVTVTAPDATAILGPDGDEHLAPYSIAATSGTGDYYNSLHITGDGVPFVEKIITLPTGVAPTVSAQEREVTVNNPWVSNRDIAYRIGVRAAQAYAGSSYTLDGSTDTTSTNLELVGSRLTGDDVMLRVVSVTSSPNGQTFRAVSDTTIDDFNDTYSGVTFTALNAILGDMTFDEWATVPLKDA